MTADIKPGDRVRDNRVWTVDGVNGDSAHLSLDGHTRLAGIHYLSPALAPAATASEPEMQEGCPAKALAYLMPHERTAENAPVVLTAGKMRESVAIIARHLAERDARIAEMERDAKQQTALYELWGKEMSALAERWRQRTLAAESRARAAEAALAAEREACALVAEWCAQCAWSREGKREAERVAVLIRARSTITAEGAETGSKADA